MMTLAFFAKQKERKSSISVFMFFCFNINFQFTLKRTVDIFYIYKRLRPSKKIRNRKKKEQQKLFNFIDEIEHQISKILMRAG